ncbi:MAG TPA: alpha/beta hydrolase [Solirubrobacteraceae bacterium]|nr:alpha/beta hydrolase [Solirubrobacteraceae bacterium]
MDTAGFSERRIRANGFEIRYLEAGDGPALVCLHGAGGLRLTRAHELLAERYRVVAFETPGFGESPVNDVSQSLPELASTMREAVAAMGLERCLLWGTSFGGKLALWFAIQEPDGVDALVLASPAAIIDDPWMPPPEEMASVLYAHPERQTNTATLAPDIDAKQRALVRRLIGPPREPALEDAMRRLDVPTLVLFGTEDRLTPPGLGRYYREFLPRGHVVIVEDAAHAIYAEHPETFAAIVGDFLAQRVSSEPAS